MANKKSSLGADALVLTVSRVMVSLLGLVTSMLLARFRTLEEYGTYSQIIMVVDLISTILLLGLPNSVNYFLAKAETAEQRQKFMSVYMFLCLLMSMIITACAYAALPLITVYFDNPLIRNFAYVFAVYPWSSLMMNSLGNTCVVCGRANRLMFFNLTQSLLSIALLLSAKLLSIPFNVYLRLQMGLLFLLAVAAVVWIRRMIGPMGICLDRKLIRTIFAFSIPIGLAGAVGTLNTELDKLVIGRFFSTEQYAIFANAAKQLPVTMLTDSLTAVLLPCMVRLLKDDRKEDAVKVWGNSINLAFCFMCLVAGGLFVFAPDVMNLFYSAKYVTPEGVAVFRIYTSILLFRFTYWGIVLNATGKTKFILYSSIVSMVLNMIGNVALYYALGFVGPAVSTLLTTAVIALAQLLFTSKEMGIGLRRIFPWRDMAVCLVETVVFGSVFWLIKRLLVSYADSVLSIVTAVLLGAVWTGIYAVINRSLIRSNWIGLNRKETDPPKELQDL